MGIMGILGQQNSAGIFCAEELEDGVAAILAQRALNLNEFSTLSRIIGASFVNPFENNSFLDAVPPFKITRPLFPQGPDLLPVLHEAYAQTHLLKLVIRLDVDTLEDVQTFEPSLWKNLQRTTREEIEKEQALLYAAASAVREIIPFLKRKVSRDIPILLRLTDLLEDEWRGYYRAVVDAGLRSIIQGMGIGGYTENAPVFEESLGNQKTKVAEQERLASPLVAILMCLFLRSLEEKSSSKDIMRALSGYQNKYGLSFSGMPGHGNIDFPAGAEPPKEIVGQKRVCTGMGYIEVLCHYAFACFKGRVLSREVGLEHYEEFVKRELPKSVAP